MNKSVVFIIILLVIVLSIIVSQYFHKRHHEYKMADIEKAIRKAGIGSIRKEELVTAVKKYFHCSAKEAHYIIGVARRKKLVDIAAEYVTIMF